MSAINPFYRFEDAIEVAGISQGAVGVSDILNQLFLDINISYAGGAVAEAVDYLTQTIDGYNALYGTQFVLETPQYPPFVFGSYNVQMYIYEPRLIGLYPLHRISIVLLVNFSGLITNNNAWFLGVIPDDYNYSAPLFDGEKSAYSALVTQYQSGAAVFPKYYKYNDATGVAESFIARFKNCKYDEEHSSALRFPLDTLPRGNKPVISFAQLNAEAKYIVSLFENVIAYSMGAGVTFFDIKARLIDLVIPSGYEYDFYESLSGVNRLQHNIFKTGGGQGFSLILREDDGFLFQRFYAPSFSTYNILADNGSGTPLPYPPNNFGKRYGGIFYDFEFCEFEDCSYPPAESYQMPIKAGDSLQFNIIPNPANVLNSTNIEIGLFDENYNLVQKVGSAVDIEPICTCFYSWTRTYTQEQFASLTVQINENSGADWNYGYIICAPDSEQVNFIASAPIPESELAFGIETLDFLISLSNNDIVVDGVINAGNSVDITISLIQQQNCINPPYELSAQIFNEFNPAGCFSTPEFTLVIDDCCISFFQKQGSVVIPAKKEGCYRFGLYKFGYSFDGLQSSWNQQPITQGTNSLLAITNQSNEVIWGVAIPTAIDDWVQLIEWLKDNIPFMNVEYDGSNYLTITAYPYIDLTNHYIKIGTYIFSTNTINPINLDESSTVTGLYDIDANELYSFSNLLELNNSDCFSTIVQYWNDNETVGEGFEYIGNWFQQVRLGINGGGKKPVITESIYRQSNGVHRRPQNKQDLSIDLHTDFIDFETQSALVDATRHQNFVVDGQNLFVNGDIDVGTIQDFTTQSSFEDLAQVKFSALIQGYQPKNSSCLNC